jgi:hypothetical protein
VAFGTYSIVLVRCWTIDCSDTRQCGCFLVGIASADDLTNGVCFVSLGHPEIWGIGRWVFIVIIINDVSLFIGWRIPLFPFSMTPESSEPLTWDPTWPVIGETPYLQVRSRSQVFVLGEDSCGKLRWITGNMTSEKLHEFLGDQFSGTHFFWNILKQTEN